MKIETPVITEANFARKIEDQDLRKEALDTSTAFVRDRVREGGFARKLIAPKFVTSADLTPNGKDDRPAILLYKDIDALESAVIPFDGKMDSATFEPENQFVNFSEIRSQEYNKNKFRMMNSQVNFLDIIKKRVVEENHNIEDKTMIAAFEQSITRGEALKPGSQKQELTGGLSKTNIKLLLQMMILNRMSPDEGEKVKILMTAKMKTELVELGMIEIGDKNVSENFNKGTSGVNTILGHPIVTTIKDDLVPNNVMYAIAPQDYFGRFFILQDHKMVIETKGPEYKFWTYAAFGLGLINPKGVAKITITDL